MNPLTVAVTHIFLHREANLVEYSPVEEFAFMSGDIYLYLRPAA